MREHSKVLRTGRSIAIGGQDAVAGEIGLIFKFKCPGQGALEIDVDICRRSQISARMRRRCSRHRAFELRYPSCGPVQAAQPSGSDSPMTIGVFLNCGNSATVRETRLDVVQLIAPGPSGHDPSSNFGLPLAWKEMKSSGEPLAPVAWLGPSGNVRKARRNFPPPPACSGPPTRAVGSAPAQRHRPHSHTV